MPPPPPTERSALGPKLLLAGGTALAAALIAWQLLPGPVPQDTVALVDASESLTEVFAERDSEGETHEPGSGSPATEPRGAGGRLPRLSIDEPQAATFFPLSRRSVFDPHTFTRRQANLSINRPFAEYPGGKWVIRTNSWGMREDEDPAEQRPDLRVIVAGDSHADGVCPNAESFSNQLEALLQEAHPGRTIEVLNVANGGWSFYNYLGALESYLWLEPDLFVVTVYGGNDFGSLPLHHYHRSEELALTGPRLRKRLAELARVQTGRAQFWNQVAYFASNPDEEAAAVEMACEVTAELQRVAQEHDIALLGVYLPPLRDVQRERFVELLSIGEQLLALRPAELAVADRLADAWAEWLEANGIALLDLRAPFRAASERLYWETDQHINVAGHALIARELLPLVEAAAALDSGPDPGRGR